MTKIHSKSSKKLVLSDELRITWCLGLTGKTLAYIAKNVDSMNTVFG